MHLIMNECPHHNDCCYCCWCLKLYYVFKFRESELKEKEKGGERAKKNYFLLFLSLSLSQSLPFKLFDALLSCVMPDVPDVWRPLYSYVFRNWIHAQCSCHMQCACWFVDFVGRFNCCCCCCRCLSKVRSNSRTILSLRS